MAGFVKVMGYTAEDLDEAYRRGIKDGTVTEVNYTLGLNAINGSTLEARVQPVSVTTEGFTHMEGVFDSIKHFSGFENNNGFFTGTNDKLVLIGDSYRNMDSKIRGYAIVACKKSSKQYCFLKTYGNIVLEASVANRTDIIEKIDINNYKSTVINNFQSMPEGYLSSIGGTSVGRTTLGILTANEGTNKEIVLVPAGVGVAIIAYAKDATGGGTNFYSVHHPVIELLTTGANTAASSEGFPTVEPTYIRVETGRELWARVDSQEAANDIVTRVSVGYPITLIDYAQGVATYTTTHNINEVIAYAKTLNPSITLSANTMSSTGPYIPKDRSFMP